MFKNVIVYRIGPGWSAQVAQMEAALEPARFVACGASQEQSAGWVEPRGEAHGPLVEAVGGQLLLKFMTEAKVLPGSVVNRKAQEQVAHIEAITGRKPGKKETREIKEDVRQALLPMAFTKQARINVWIDPVASLLLVDAASQGKADEVVTALVKSLEGLSLTLLNTKTSPTAAMSEWLTSQEPPAGFSVDRECELKAADESKSVVRYAHHALDIDEVRQHIEAGKLPTKLALTWEGRVSLLLTESLQIKKIAFLEGVFDGTSQEKEDGFDADAAIATGELRKLMPDLLLALGGEVVPG
ncbi:recombination-associated protein RdgC [Rhodoferax sediminis]|uniref:Recombination-associated protein RdgC n=1 Tax=Rhodoferax sediminis TaxID=2509614 RepID=A0A515DHL4_9BURK|nr:recombination-associated protein RdgC [Rhodoferax sediminis]QDL39905.1 recombination-associated protein RdgC [Rhodoferax sediminis]